MCALNLKSPVQRDADAAQAVAPKPRPASRNSNHNSNSASKMPDWVRAQDPMTRRLVISVCGEWKAGKNYFAFGFPGPIYIHSFDKRIRGVVEQFQEQKEIFICDYPSPTEIQLAEDYNVDKIAAQSGEVWDWFVEKFNESVEKTANEGTVIVDTGSEAYSLRLLKEFGKLKQNNSFAYDEPKAEFRALVRRSQLGTNAVWLHKLKDEYSKPTGPQDRGHKIGRKFAGLTDFQYLVDANLLAEREDLEGGGSVYTVRILDCGVGRAAEINGAVIPNDYDMLVSTIFGE